MKRQYVIGLIFSFIINTWQVWAQQTKPVIDSAAFEQWSTLVGNGDITADGRYASYVQREGDKETTIIKSTAGNWQRNLLVGNTTFLADNKQAIYQSNDTLYFIKLGTDKVNFITGVQSIELLSGHNNEWLLYKLKGNTAEVDLHVLNTETNQDLSIGNINDYYFFENSASLLFVKSKMQGDKVVSNTLFWYDLLHHRTAPAFSMDGPMPSLVTCKVVDAFCYPKIDTLDHTSALLFYKKGMSGPVTLVDNSSVAKMDPSLILCDWSSCRPVFMKDGRHICFQVKGKNKMSRAIHESKVTVWRYNDAYLPTDLWPRKEFKWSVSAIDNKLVPLENHEYELMSDPADCQNYLVCRKMKSVPGTFWQKDALNSFSVMSLSNSKQVIISEKVKDISNRYLSPTERFVVYYDPVQVNYFCFDVLTAQTRNLTAALNQHWAVKSNRHSIAYSVEHPIAGWLSNDEAVLICADYDIWKLDLKGSKPPVNITHGFGARNHIRFRIAEESNQQSEKLVLADDQKLLLYAFDSATKKSGFYSKRMDAETDPILLNMDNYAYTRTDHGNNDLAFQKAKKATRWIIKRETASLSPNLFYTTDFKNFSLLSDIHPEKNYNWLTSELITWELPEGQYSQGILYKPENFDSSKKHPVIFDYYEERSDELNQFIEPRWSIDRINIPYFVSHGYIVVVPDIHYKIAEVGESALKVVLSAAKHLSTYFWIDSMKIALQGHSFGGGETNYIITHSKFFAAACEAAGPSDAISCYGSLVGYGPNAYSFSQNLLPETSQDRMRASLAEIPEAYIKASPVLKTANVTTPLLMMHNQNDGNVPWNQGVEFFTGLKRMGKRVWMLEYENAGHSIFGAKAKDYTIRMLQFFDHYLKGAPVPKWMLEGGGLSYDLDTAAPEPEEKEVLFKGKYQRVNQVNSSNN